MTARVVVVGGGIVGASLAWRLAQAGAEVTLVEANALASGTSATSFAWLNANGKPPIDYHRLNWAGVVEHIRLREELGSAPWLHLGGNLTWEVADPQGATEPDIPIQGERLAARISRLREWNYPLDILNRTEAGRAFPELALPEEVDRYAFFPAEGYCDVPLLVGTFLRLARSLGATILDHDAVRGFVWKSGRVSGVTMASGMTLEADVVVTCAGRWTEQVLAEAGIRFPMSPTRGLLAITSPIASSHRSLVHSPGVNLRPDGGSRFMLANYDMDERVTEDDTPDSLTLQAEELLMRAGNILPALRDARVESVRIGIRSIPGDGFPVIGSVPGIDGLHVVATHSGVTMGPLLGRLAGREIVSGVADERLLPYRPDRLAPAAT